MSETPAIHILRPYGPWPLTAHPDPYYEPDPTMLFRTKPRALAWCHKCHRRRFAENLEIRISYAAVYISCIVDCQPWIRANRRRQRKRAAGRRTGDE